MINLEQIQFFAFLKKDRIYPEIRKPVKGVQYYMVFNENDEKKIIRLAQCSIPNQTFEQVHNNRHYGRISWSKLEVSFQENISDIPEIYKIVQAQLDSHSSNRMLSVSQFKKDFTIVEARFYELIHYRILGGMVNSFSFSDNEIDFTIDHCEIFIEE